MFLTILKSFLSVIFTLIKPFLFVIIPLIVCFFLSFFIAYIQKKRSGECSRNKIAQVNPSSDVSLFVKLFVQLPRQFWENYYNRDIGEFNEHGIIMYTGKQGKGKTLAMTHDIMNLQYKYPSCKVCTNYGYKKEDEVIDDWRKLVDYNNGKLGVICAIDECQNWFSSKQSKNFPPRMLDTVTQNRKNKRIIMLTSHYFSDVAKPIRKHTTEVRACNTLLRCFTIVTRKEPELDSEGNIIGYRKLGRYCFVHNKALYEAYDTYNVIKNLSESGFIEDNYYADDESQTSPPASTSRRRRGLNRNVLSENLVNSQIDNALNLINGGSSNEIL